MIPRKAYLRTLNQITGITAFLFLFGCSTPDTWYDLDSLYEERPLPESSAEVDESLLPAAELPKKLPLPATEGGHLFLSLEEAVSFSLERNHELQVQRYAPLITGTFEQIERGVFDPELFAELDYSEEKATETSRSTEELFSVEGSDVGTEAGVRQQLPTGTELEVSLAYGRSRSNRTPEQQDVRLGLSVTQSLLRGFGPAVNLLDIRQAQLDTKVSFYELRGFLEALVSEVEIAYWRYVLSSQSITIFEQSLEIAGKQLTEVENRIEVGVIPKNAAAAARAELARRQQALIEARGTHNERRLRLLRLLNITDNDNYQLRVEPTSTPRTDITPLADLDDHLQLAVLMRPDLNEARLRQRRQGLEIVRTRNGLLPKLELFIDLAKTGYAESFNDTWSNLKEDNYELLTGIRFSSYVNNRTAEAQHLAARASRDQAGAAVKNLENLVKLDVLLAANELERAREQIAASGVTRMFAEQTLKAEQERFSVGDITSLLVAQAQRDLLVSRLDEIEAIIEYRIALVNLYLAEGSLLDRRGIRLEN